VKLAASQELHAYWSGLRGARSAPERAEIDPAAIRGVLADTFILELDESRGYPIRIAGTRTNLLFDRELKGAAFVDLWRKPDQLEIAAVLACVADEAVAVANSTAYGLSAGLITGDNQRGFTLAQRIDSGVVHVNDQTVADEPQLPLGA